MSREPHRYHEDADLFRAALSYTQSETGFSARLVEKDYYCSLVLADLLAMMTGQDESIKVEFSIREPILEPVERLPAHTLLVDPFRQVMAVAPMEVPVLSCRETYAEKLRAALTRREPAIRDFYDIDHGVQSGRLKTDDRRLTELVRSKLAVSGNDPIDISDEKHDILKRQVQGQLRPSQPFHYVPPHLASRWAFSSWQLFSFGS